MSRNTKKKLATMIQLLADLENGEVCAIGTLNKDSFLERFKEATGKEAYFENTTNENFYRIKLK